MGVFLNVLLIFVVRVVSIAIGTLRIMLMGRANNWLVALLAFLESLTFALTFGIVAQDLTNIPNLAAYSLGFAFGTIAGTWVEDRVAQGFATVNIVSKGKSQLIAETIRAAGFGATRSTGEGATGAQGVVWAVVRRREVGDVMKLAKGVDNKAFITVVETRGVQQGFLRYGRS